MPDRIEPCAVLSELDQQPLQLDQQGGEATGSCGLWIWKEQELARVGGSARLGEQRATAATAGGDAGGVELHRRDVLHRAGHAFALCSCGWIGRGQVTDIAAWQEPCEVEILLAESAERKRRLVEAHR